MDKALKQRLVGATVLIIFAVIVLPMLLSGRSDRLHQESRQIELPPKPDELSIETRRFPVVVDARPAPAQEQATAENEDTGEGEQLSSVDAIATSPEAGEQPAGGQDKPKNQASPVAEMDDSIGTATETESKEVTTVNLAAPDEEIATAPVVESDEKAPRYLVQVASFSNEKNANALAGLLKAENLSVLLDVVDRPAGRMYRVRVGPYAKRTEADDIVSSLGRKMTEVNPRVLDLRPDESAPVSTPSDPLVRWVVQVGSFSNPTSAEDLVARLRLEGLSAFSEKVTSASGTAYKVRIGPELDRDKATEMARKVKAEHNIDAFVTTLE